VKGQFKLSDSWVLFRKLYLRVLASMVRKYKGGRALIWARAYTKVPKPKVKNSRNTFILDSMASQGWVG